VIQLTCLTPRTGNRSFKKIRYHYSKTQDVLERTNLCGLITLFNNKVSVALFNYDKLHTLVSMVTATTKVTVIKQWVQLCDPLLHTYGFSCHMRVVWLPNLTLHSSMLTGASFASTSEVWMFAILE
jgi:hypothetical protein